MDKKFFEKPENYYNREMSWLQFNYRILDGNKIVTSEQIQEAMQPSIEKIIDLVKATLEKTPPELASDIMENGIMLTGGGALLKGLDKLVKEETGMPVKIAENPLDCVAIGTGKSVEDQEIFEKVLMMNNRK